ncbi:GAF sensor hybrid histidine kinase [Streptomyces sp. C]|nr:GAF sensor hybrid histidine kinase [Streptomyces sp. C]
MRVETGSRPCRDHESPSTRLDIGCQVTYLRGRHEAVVPDSTRGVRPVCDGAEVLSPGSARVKHWAGLESRLLDSRCPVEQRSTLSGGTRWSLAQRCGVRERGPRAGGPGGTGPRKWTPPL